jgi:tripartite ATP-independent transporter DctP family solute receptor
MGGLDFAMTMTSILESYDPRFEAISLPFVFRDWDHVFKVVDGAVGQKLNSFIEPKGIIISAYFLNGDLHVASTIPIKGPEDMKGIKLRCQQAKTMLEFGKALETVVTPMPYGEVFTALQLGTIDAEVQNLSNLLFDKHYEVVDYVNEATPFYYLEPLLMSRMVFEELPEDIQKAVFEAAREAAEWQRQLYLDNRDNEFIPQLKEHGVTFIPSPDKPWRKALEDAGYYEVFAEHQELVDEILAVE